MYVCFIICVTGFIVVLFPYFLSLEHLKLEEEYGKQKAKRIGELLGLISGWGFFLLWFGIWLSPQDRFIIPFFQDSSLQIPLLGFKIYLVNLLVFIPFFIVAAWFGIRGVIDTSLKVAETHRTEKVVTTGVYSIIRHPQYFGGILAHIGFSFLMSGLYSLLATPLVIAIVYIISWKEELELLKEFGQDYEEYKAEVSMFIPKFHSHKRIG